MEHFEPHRKVRNQSLPQINTRFHPVLPKREFLLKTDGESRAAEVFRVVPFLVVDGNIGTVSSVFPIVNKWQRTKSLSY